MTNDFGMKLKNLRALRGVSQSDLAAALGLSKQAISSYETGARKPDFDGLDAMADFLDVSIDYLVGASTVLESYPRHGDDRRRSLVRITDEEKAVLDAYRKADPDLRAAVNTILKVEK